jgi:hypothetical protein
MSALRVRRRCLAERCVQRHALAVVLDDGFVVALSSSNAVRTLERSPQRGARSSRDGAAAGEGR